jgi:hypothetical protein
MEAQAADMVEKNEKEMHARAVAAGLVFDRSDDDEIVSITPHPYLTWTHLSPTGRFA